VRRGPGTRGQARRAPRLGRLGRLGRRLLFGAVLLAAGAGGGWMWFRDSSLVAVRQVAISGLRGPDAGAVRRALVLAARNMTTLDVRSGALAIAVEPYPVVRRLQIHAVFPHTLRIGVVEQIPVAVISAGGMRAEVASDGTILRDLPPSSSLPTIDLSVAPAGDRVNGAALSVVHLLAAAPPALLGRVGQTWRDPVHGLAAQLRNGPRIYFGADDDLGAKWANAAAVLADSGSAGAQYIDVTDPSRPAAGTGSDGPTGQRTAGQQGSTGGG
ncbi:MAG: cell division protein FtsQ/DivIB, partial [Solirubrobacteraceae bacterium]